MLKRMAAEALGISDIGKIISPSDYDKVDADDFIMHEDGEKIFFLIKSQTDEYCFTNEAFIHVDGTNAMSKKRLVKRYPYYLYNFSNIAIETAGTVDLDCEIKFNLQDHPFSIDVHRNQIEQLKDLYKALTKIQEITRENAVMLGKTNESLNIASNLCKSAKIEQGSLSQIFKEINEYSFNWMSEARRSYVRKDFTDIFKNYINN